MYFPYLRGRQFELLALRELLTKGLLGTQIIPVIEPVKLSSTLVKTMEAFVEQGQQLAFITNPSVGSFKFPSDEEERDRYADRLLQLFNHSVIIKAHIIQKNSREDLKREELKGIAREDRMIINATRGLLPVYIDEFTQASPRYVLIPDESSYKRHIRRNLVLLSDNFERQSRNADYGNEPDEFFSESHLYYKEEGYIGFADYSVIGDVYAEAGFAPYAVAIHIVYFAPNGELWVRHFVSTTNDDPKNPAKKFYEALEQLVKWYSEGKIVKTVGLSQLLEHYNNQTYPGLGSIKKLSIMHHLELMGKHLDGENA